MGPHRPNSSVRRGFALVRSVAAVVGLALFLLLAQQHRHEGGLESKTCVACSVHAQRATPAGARPPLIVPLQLLALAGSVEADTQAPSRTAPTPRAQGPPKA
jgi:hypothetical protein